MVRHQRSRSVLSSVVKHRVPCGTRPAFFHPVENEDTGTEVHCGRVQAGWRAPCRCVYGVPLPEEGAGKGFFLLLLLITEEFPFIRVHGNDTFLAIR